MRTNGFLIGPALFSVCLAATGCGAVMAALPDVIAIVSSAQPVIEQIVDFADRHFKAHPNSDLEAKVDAAVAKTRAALAATGHAARGTQGASRADAEAAQREFVEAYRELLEVTKEIGVRSGEAALKAEPGRSGEALLTVPAPETFAR
jgi:hypothetical protein